MSSSESVSDNQPHGSTNTSSASAANKGSKTAAVVTKGILAFAESSKCPSNIKVYVVKAAPIIGLIIQFIEDSVPYCIKAYNSLIEYYDKLRPYRPELLVPSVIGLVMCFFGGSFLTLIAAWEAFNMVGYDSLSTCFALLYEDFNKVVEANNKDNTEDKDNDGVADVLQISNQDLLKRKSILFLRNIDPNRLSVALAGINAGFLAILATLKLKFAKTITLGNAIGSLVEKPAKAYVIPHLESMVPDDYKKWVSPLLCYSIRTTSISIAWFVQRIISAFHSAMRGGLMFSRNILYYLSAMNYYKINHEDTYLDEIIGYGVAALGLYFQLSLGFSLPFPLNIIMFPFTLAEYFLIWAVNYMT